MTESIFHTDLIIYKKADYTQIFLSTCNTLLTTLQSVTSVSPIPYISQAAAGAIWILNVAQVWMAWFDVLKQLISRHELF